MRITVTALCLLFTNYFFAQDSTEKKPLFQDIFASGYYYNFPNEDFQYGMFIGGAYWGNVYTEVRYNYEELRTGTLLGGYSFGGEKKKFSWELIPMAGFAVGELDAFIPALQAELNLGRFKFFSQNEYAIAFNSEGRNFFYSWNELTYALVKWFSPGIVTQRTKLSESNLVMNRGFMFNSTFLPKSTVSAYLFEPFNKDEIFFSFGLTIEF